MTSNGDGSDSEETLNLGKLNSWKNNLLKEMFGVICVNLFHFGYENEDEMNKTTHAVEIYALTAIE